MTIGSRVWKNRIRDFLKKFVTSQIIGPNNVQIGLSVFSDVSKTETKFFLNTYDSKDPMFATVGNLPYPTGQTCISCGLKKATDECFVPSNGDRSDAKNIAILLTDGVSNRLVDENELETQRLKDASDELYVIGINPNNVNETELSAIADDPDSHYLEILQNFAGLTPFINKLNERMNCPVT
ncbi:hypothetical protein LSH36_164g06032 [Paralvinella palmiformis]|uniref:VWFA domain-containing protein n=1 Tax=Paralvinella palmiformis TaxID=53620 RepID=A0AAD9JUB9_9ANNE|nr:hypothetical protein LSH36_164g06032 [Paralvinella palmiformis]